MKEIEKAGFAICIGAMLETFGVEATDPILHGYWLGLEDLALDQVKLAVANAIRSRKTVPKPVELRELAGLITDPNAIAQLAFSKAMDAISSHGPYKTVSFQDRTINAVIRSMGGWPNFCARFTDAESEKWVRIDFIRGYTNYANRPVSEEATAPLIGISEVTNNQPATPKLIGCDWSKSNPVLLATSARREVVPMIELKKAE